MPDDPDPPDEPRWSTTQVLVALAAFVAVLIVGGVALIVATTRVTPVEPGCAMTSSEPAHRVEEAIGSIEVPDEVVGHRDVYCSYATLNAYRSFQDSDEAAETIRSRLLDSGWVPSPVNAEAYCWPGTPEISANLVRYQPSQFDTDEDKDLGHFEVSLSLLPGPFAGCAQT